VGKPNENWRKEDHGYGRWGQAREKKPKTQGISTKPTLVADKVKYTWEKDNQRESFTRRIRGVKGKACPNKNSQNEDGRGILEWEKGGGSQRGGLVGNH